MPSKTKRRQQGQPPIFWIVAGPNGSGKSSLYKNTRIDSFDGSVWIINPDLLTTRIVETEKLSRRKANLASVQRIWKWLETSIDAHQTVGVETVLSTDKYKKLVRAAKVRGFEVRLIYVILRSPVLNVERVRERVRTGGHNVPRRKIIERYQRSLAQMPWFFFASDKAYIYDNSRRKPRLMVQKEGQRIWAYQNIMPEIINALWIQI